MRGTLRAAVGLTLLTGVTATCDGTPMGRDEGPYAFVGVHVIPMTEDGLVLRDQTVIVEGDRIAAIGPRADRAVPDEARRIEAEGRYLIPGLADMHVHLEHFDDPEVLRLFVANGVTLVRNMDGRPYILGWRDSVASGALLGPAIVTAGPIIDGDPPLRDDNLAVATAAEADSVVSEQAARGYDFIKLYTNLSNDAYDAALAAAARHGLPVAGHAPADAPFDAVLSGGQGSLEHLDGYDDLIEADDSPFRNGWHWTKLYLAMPADSEKIERAAERTRDADLWNVPTLALKDALVSHDEMMARLDDPTFAYVPRPIREYWESYTHETGGRLGPDDLDLLAAGGRHRGALVRALRRHGAGILAGTDTPNPFLVPGFSLHEELASLVRAGLTPAEALAAATREPARFLDASEEHGTIEPGKRADLVLLEANPLDDIRNTRSVAGVMLRGRWLPDPESLLPIVP